MDTLLGFLAQPYTVMILVGLLVAATTYLFTRNPAWAKYEGLMITAVKMAEKLIPDDTPNKSMQRANAALLEFIAQYKRVYNAAPSRSLLLDVEANLPLVHADLESNGNLRKPNPLLDKKESDETTD